MPNQSKDHSKHKGNVNNKTRIFLPFFPALPSSNRHPSFSSQALISISYFHLYPLHLKIKPSISSPYVHLVVEFFLPQKFLIMQIGENVIDFSIFMCQ